MSATTDWITAVSGAFAAVGTVGAVTIALWQTREQSRRRVHVTCSLAVMIPDTEPLTVVALRATNIGYRPVKLVQAYLTTDDNRHVVSPFVRPGPFQSFTDSDLPKVLDDGESVEVFWYQDKLNEAKETEGFGEYLSAFFYDAQGNAYQAPFPGMQAHRRLTWRRGPKRTTQYLPRPTAKRSRFRLFSKDPADYR